MNHIADESINFNKNKRRVYPRVFTKDTPAKKHKKCQIFSINYAMVFKRALDRQFHQESWS